MASMIKMPSVLPQCFIWLSLEDVFCAFDVGKLLGKNFGGLQMCPRLFEPIRGQRSAQRKAADAKETLYLSCILESQVTAGVSSKAIRDMIYVLHT